jgi:hypothetical protein
MSDLIKTTRSLGIKKTALLGGKAAVVDGIVVVSE